MDIVIRGTLDAGVAMADEEVLAAALSDPDAQPLDPEELARCAGSPP
jgi:hypothetical protein